MKFKKYWALAILIILIIGGEIYTNTGEMFYWNIAIPINTGHKLYHYYHSCNRFPTTEEGLIKLKTEESCPGYEKMDARLSFKNGFGNELKYTSDGKTLKIVSESFYRDRVFTEKDVLDDFYK